MLHVLMEYPRLDLPLLLHWLPSGLDLRLAPHLRLGMLHLLHWRLPLELLRLTLELLRLPLELLLGRHRLALELLWLSLKLLGLPLELLRLTPLELLRLSLELLVLLPLELALSRGRRVPHLRLPLIVLGVHSRRGLPPLLSPGDEYHSRERDER